MSEETSRDRRGAGLLRGDPVVGGRGLLMRRRAEDAAAAAACYPSVGGAVRHAGRRELTAVGPSFRDAAG